MTGLRVNLFRNGRSAFLSLLREHKIEFIERPPMPGAIVASGDVIYIVDAAGVAGAIAGVLITWLRGRATRKIMVQIGRDKVVQLEGYTADQATKLLSTLDPVSAATVTLIQTDKDDT
jgi:hypothetical protein